MRYNYTTKNDTSDAQGSLKPSVNKQLVLGENFYISIQVSLSVQLKLDANSDKRKRRILVIYSAGNFGRSLWFFRKKSFV